MPDHDDQHADEVPAPHVGALRALQDHIAAMPSDATAIEQLIHIKELEALLDAALDLTVGAARTDGRSWRSIGEALHMRRQSAQERWGSNSGIGEAHSPDADEDGTPGGESKAPKSCRLPPATLVVEDVEARLTSLSLFKLKAQFRVKRRPAPTK